ncbi:hypothetical protein [Actinophytocola sp.]|uniref:hypothetical protein n=1 Tax=Actinophytocola sp. TaxID=1872138 RepID=UPI002D7F20F8|nr:hypothetical protein [Actinophytocola sp.]HET9138020.1 hypothetical protein [Actinophytocola sp.]
MPSLTMNLAELRRVVPDGVIRGAELRAAGVSSYAVSMRCRPSGPWRRLLPGVVLMGTGPPNPRQRLRAAVAYAGPGAVLSGAEALRCHGIEVPAGGDLLILLPARRRTASRDYLTVERTTRPPEPVWCDALPLAPVARAAVDAARRERDRGRLHALLSAPLRAGVCTVAELHAELAAGSRWGSAAPRAVLAELAGLPRAEGSPVLVGELPFDVPDVDPGARRTQPDPAPGAALRGPGERLDRRVPGLGSTASGTTHVGRINHET